MSLSDTLAQPILASANTLSAFPSSDQPPASPPKKCSVRGCKHNVIVNSGTKMCEVCRGRHRIYATTKRAKRKLEKAAVVGMRKMSEQRDNGASISASPSVEPGTKPDLPADTDSFGWIATQASELKTTSTTTRGDTATVPQLFSQSVSAPAPSADPVNLMNLHLPSYPPMSYVSSTSSELAGALTLPDPASVGTIGTVDAPRNNTSYYRPRLPDGRLIQLDSTTNTSPPSGSGTKERVRLRVVAKKQEEEEGSVDENENGKNEESQTSTSSTRGDQVGATLTDIQNPEVGGPTRFCSVKGCKAVIPASYTFKMCPPCRVRYRIYGITKRAKWKAEQEAFDHELAGLRSKEDERRKLAGERSLSESPEELHAWELSILDEEVPLPPEVLTVAASTLLPGSLYATGVPSNGDVANADINVVDPNPPGEGDHLVKAIDTPHSVLPYPRLNHPLSKPTFQLPARMCTVSHCHKLLPGLYRYKRCEQHRLQNRYHSKLKRVREKEAKAVGPTGEEECLVVDMEDVEVGEKNKEKEAKKKAKRKKMKASEKEGEGGEEEGEDVAKGISNAEQSPGILFTHTSIELGETGDEEKKPRKRAFTCTTNGCCNLLSLEIRWRNCGICRAKERIVKREKRVAEQTAAEEVGHLREIVKSTEARVGMSSPEMGMQNGEMQVGASGTDVDASTTQVRDSDGEEDDSTIPEDRVDLNGNEGDADMANLEGEPDFCLTGSDAASLLPEQSAPPAPPTRGTEPNGSPVTISSGSKGGTYHSIFRTTAAPSLRSPPVINVDKNDKVNENAAEGSTRTTTPTILTANLADTDGLMFKTYQPKQGSSTVARLLAQNPELSVRVLRDLMPPREKQENTGLVGPSSYHVYRSTPPPAREPTVFALTVPRTPPLAKKARMNTGEDSQMQEGKTSGQGAAAPPSGSGLVQTPTMTALTTTSTARKKSRAVPKPPQSPLQPPPSPYPYSSIPSSQYPYQYYVSPYGMPPYGMPPPPSPPTSTAPPYLPYPYYYTYLPPYGPPPPGYIYATPGYAPAPYSQPPQQQDVHVPQLLQPRTYPLPYGCPDGAEYSYAHDPPQPKEYSFVVPRQRHPKRKRVDPGPTANVVVTTAVPAVDSSTSGVAPAAAGSGVTPRDSLAATGDIGSAGNDATMSKPPAEQETDPSPSRPCRNKPCHRTISAGMTGALCEKCRLRLKKHQAKAKQRFKLEPRRSVLGTVRGMWPTWTLK